MLKTRQRFPQIVLKIYNRKLLCGLQSPGWSSPGSAHFLPCHPPHAFFLPVTSRTLLQFSRSAVFFDTGKPSLFPLHPTVLLPLPHFSLFSAWHSDSIKTNQIVSLLSSKLFNGFLVHSVKGKSFQCLQDHTYLQPCIPPCS